MLEMRRPVLHRAERGCTLSDGRVIAVVGDMGYAISYHPEVCAYQGKSSHSEIYTAADMMQYGNNPVIEPYGSLDFVGGFPVGAFDSVGVIVGGKDDNQAPLSFTGYIAF